MENGSIHPTKEWAYVTTRNLSSHDAGHGISGSGVLIEHSPLLGQFYKALP